MENEIQNAISKIKSTNAQIIRDGLRSGCDILFFNNGKDFKFGIDSHFRLQVRNENWTVRTKKDVLERLKFLLDI